MATRLKSDIS
ncbi:hypothetical protein YPPY02_3618, partial [Yersinia pestis PY-02]